MVFADGEMKRRGFLGVWHGCNDILLWWCQNNDYVGDDGVMVKEKLHESGRSMMGYGNCFAF